MSLFYVILIKGIHFQDRHCHLWSRSHLQLMKKNIYYHCQGNFMNILYIDFAINDVKFNKNGWKTLFCEDFSRYKKNNLSILTGMEINHYYKSILWSSVLTLYEGGLSWWGGDSHRRNVNRGLAGLSNVPLVVWVLWMFKWTTGSFRALLGGDG